MKLVGTICRAPVIREKVSYSSLTTDRGPVELVLFPKQRPVKVVNQFNALNVGDNVKIEGRYQMNPQNGQNQVVIDDLINENTSDADEVESTLGKVDASVGVMKGEDYRSLIPRDKVEEVERLIHKIGMKAELTDVLMLRETLGLSR